MRKKLRLIIYPFFLLLLLLGGGGYYFLHTQLALHLVVDSLRQAATKFLGGEVTADGWQGDLLHGLTVTNLSVRTDGRQWLAIRKVALRFDAFPLLIGLMHVKSVIISKPELTLAVDRSGNIAIPFKGREKNLLQEFGWRGLGHIDHFAVTEGTIHWQKRKGGVSLRDCTDFDMRGKAGFYFLPGSKKWSAWLSISTGSLHLAPNDLDVALTANRIAFQADRLEGRGLHFRTPRSDFSFDLVLPYDGSNAMSLRWRNDALSLREFGLDNDQQIVSSGSLVSVSPPPALTDVHTRARRQSVPAYKIEQKLWFAGYPFTIDGRIEQPLTDHAAFQGRLRFANLDGHVLPLLLKGLNLTVAAEKVRKLDKLSNLDGSLYLDTRMGVAGERLWRGTLHVWQAELGKIRFRKVELPFRLEGDTLLANNVMVDTDKGSFYGNLSCSFEPSKFPFQAQGRIEHFWPAFLPAGLLTEHDLTATTELHLNQNSTLVFRGELEPVSIDGHQVAGGHFAGNIQGGITTLQELDLQVDMGKVVLAGKQDHDNLSAAFHFEQLPLQLLYKKQDGTVSGSGTLQKSSGTPFQLSLNLSRLDSKGLQVTNLQGTFPFSSQEQGNQNGGFHLQADRMLWNKAEFTNLEMAGTRKGNRFSLDSALARFDQENWRLTRPATLLLDGADFFLQDFDLVSEQSELSGSLQRHKELLHGGLKVERLRLPGSLLLLPWSNGPNAMLYDMDLKVDGPLSRPVVSFSGKAYPQASEQKVHMDLEGRMRDDQLRISAVLHAANQAIPINLQMPMHLSVAPFSLRYDPDRLIADSSLSDGALADFPFLAAYGCDGHFQFEMKVTPKNGQADRLTVRLHFTEANCRIPDTNLALEEGDLFFHGDEGRFVLEPTKIKTNQGILQVQGAVSDFQHYPEVNYSLSLNSDSLNLNYRGIYNVSLSGNLVAEVKNGKRSLRGNLTVLSADLKQPMQAVGFDRSDNTIIYASRSAPEGVQRTDILGDLDRLICGTSLDVRIDLPEKVELHAGALSLQLAGSLHAGGGDNGGLELKGKLSAVDGSYSVAGREFKVEKGEVVFSRENGLNPLLKGKAVCRMPDLIVTAKVRGTVEKPLILLESDPWMKEDEIESALVFGKPVTDLSAKEKNQFDTSVAALLGGTVLNRFKAMTGNQALLDSFSFYSDQQTEGESIAVGKYLTSDLLFSYRQGVMENNAGEVRVEYKLKGGFSLESLYSEEGQKSGFNFFWSKDF